MVISIRQLAVNTALMAAFSFSAVIIVIPFVSELEMNAAKRYAAANQSQKAEEKFLNSIRIDPFNADRAARYGEFLLSQDKANDSKGLFLEKAKALYGRAASLNPANAEYWLKLGVIELRLDMSSLDSGKTGKIMGYFRKAFENDPNSVYISYSIGYTALSLWDLLDYEDRKFVLKRLRYTVTMCPYYSHYIYAKLWRHTKNFALIMKITPENKETIINLYNFVEKNNLWQFHKEVDAVLDSSGYKAERIDSIKRMFKESGASKKITENFDKKDWRGTGADGKTEIIDGVMYCNGTIYAPLRMKAGKAVIYIEAKKLCLMKHADSYNSRLYPFMIVRLDGEEIGEAFVGVGDWREYKFTTKTDGGIKVISVSFVNDVCAVERGEERNLCIGNVRVTYE
jgi:hypothetical protein